MTAFPEEADPINFGQLPDAIDALLQRGVAAYRYDRRRAEALFRQALAAAPQELPIYFCLYKIHAYQGHLDEARTAAENGLREAARQAGWPLDWRHWRKAANEMAQARPSNEGSIWLAKGWGSTSRVLSPPLSSARARVTPAIPAPAMITSASGLAFMARSALAVVGKTHHMETRVDMHHFSGG